MDKEYALEIINLIELRTLESGGRLAKEAISYLDRLNSNRKNLDKQLFDRLYKIKYGIV